MTQSTQTSVQVVTSIYEAFARGDIPAVLGVMDENIEWNESEGGPWYPGHPFVGPQQVLENIFGRLGDEFEDFRIQCLRFIDGGDTVVVEARYQATQHRATGKPLDVQTAHVWDVRNGSVTRFQQYVDTRTSADVMGVSTS